MRDGSLEVGLIHPVVMGKVSVVPSLTLSPAVYIRCLYTLNLVRACLYSIRLALHLLFGFKNAIREFQLELYNSLFC